MSKLNEVTQLYLFLNFRLHIWWFKRLLVRIFIDVFFCSVSFIYWNKVVQTADIPKDVGLACIHDDIQRTSVVGVRKFNWKWSGISSSIISEFEISMSQPCIELATYLFKNAVIPFKIFTNNIVFDEPYAVLVLYVVFCFICVAL